MGNILFWLKAFCYITVFLCNQKPKKLTNKENKFSYQKNKMDHICLHKYVYD